MDLYIGLAMLSGLVLAFYVGLKNQYTAQEGTLAIILVEVLFISLALIGYGLLH